MQVRRPSASKVDRPVRPFNVEKDARRVMLMATRRQSVFQREGGLIKFLWSKISGPTRKDRAANNQASAELKHPDRRQAVYALSAMAGGGALSALPQGAMAQTQARCRRRSGL